jgi:hypothetical protein
MRGLVTFPEGNRSALSYGCSECSWKYLPIIKNDPDLNSRLAQEIAYLQAQIAFDSHDCKYFKTSHPKSSHDPRCA